MEGQPTRGAKTRVVIIDDHTMLNELITSVVNSLKGFQVVGSARTEGEALKLCGREAPDLVVLDLVLSSTYDLSLLAKLERLCPQARIVIFSGNLTPEIIRQVLAAGTYSLISKTATLADFRAALLTIAAGRTYFSPDVSGLIKGLVVGRKTPSPKLTRREEGVLRLLAQGHSSREIAAALGVSVYTVANHRSRLMKKTGLHRAAQLSLFAVQQGMLGQQALLGRT
ncbi:MAG TPA: response regulator transcription factor [Lacunisphaera sp.]|nr:response regulator transcription factor [Lacunisphaera sp.]